MQRLQEQLRRMEFFEIAPKIGQLSDGNPDGFRPRFVVNYRNKYSGYTDQVTYELQFIKVGTEFVFHHFSATLVKKAPYQEGRSVQQVFDVKGIRSDIGKKGAYELLNNLYNETYDYGRYHRRKQKVRKAPDGTGKKSGTKRM